MNFVEGSKLFLTNRWLSEKKIKEKKKNTKSIFPSHLENKSARSIDTRVPLTTNKPPTTARKPKANKSKLDRCPQFPVSIFKRPSKKSLQIAGDRKDIVNTREREASVQHLLRTPALFSGLLCVWKPAGRMHMDEK